MSEMAMSSHLLRGLLPLPHVQFWETENSWRLDRSHRGGHRRDIPCLVDASHVRTVNALEAPSGVVNERNGDVSPTASLHSVVAMIATVASLRRGNAIL